MRREEASYSPRMRADIYGIRKADGGWVGIGRLLNDQTGQPAKVRVLVRLNPATEQNTRSAVLSEGTYRLDFKEEDLLEAELG